MLFRLLEQAFDLGDLADIGLDRDGFGAGLGGFDFFADFVRAGFAVGVVDYDTAAAFSEFDGAASSDAAAGAGDEGDFAMEGGCWDEDWLLGHDDCEMLGLFLRLSVVVNGKDVAPRD